MIFIKRFFLRIAGLFALLLLLCGSALAADAQISEMKTDCQILSDGSCQMTQTITVDVTGLASELRFPLPEGAKKASVAGYQAKKTMDGDNPVLVLEDAVGFSGSRTFIVTYTTGRLAAGQEDGSQLLRLPLQCPKWEYPVADYSFTVTLPTPVSAPAPSFSSGYYGDVIADMIELRSSEGVISGRIPAGLKDHEALEMTMRFESGYFSGAYAAASAGWVRTAAVALLCVCAFAYWALTLRSPGLHAVSRALPPDSALPCDLPFLLCGAKPDFNMLVLQWANLGYVSIGVSQKGNVSLYKCMDMGNERRSIETKLFAILFSQGDRVDGASVLYKQTAQRAAQALTHYWQRRLYSRSSGNVRIAQLLCALACGAALTQAAQLLFPASALRWLTGAVLLLAGTAASLPILTAPQAVYTGSRLRGLLALASAVLLLLPARLCGSVLMLPALLCTAAMGALTMHGGQRTRFGTQMISQALGFRRFLLRVSEKHLLMMLRRDGQYYYELLPYAHAIGLGGGFSRLFGDAELEPCGWYQEAKPLPRTALGFYERLKETLALLELSVRN